MQLSTDDPLLMDHDMPGELPHKGTQGSTGSGLAPTYNRNLEVRNMTIHPASGA